MSQIQKAPKKSIFAQQIELQNTIRNDPSVTFFRRLTRPRNNTFNHIQLAKFLKVKYPLVFGFAAAFIFDYTMHFYTDAPKGH